MNTKHFLFGIVLVLLGALPMSAQVSNDNEDEVYKVARPQAKDFVPGQVLFKLKDGQQAHVRRVAGRVQSAGISSLDKVLAEYGAQEMEQLLPNAKVKGTPRRAKAYNGETIVERDLTQLYKLTLPEEKAMETMQLVEQLKALPEVEFAEPNYKVYLTETTNLANCTNLTSDPEEQHIADSYSSNPMETQQWYLEAYGVKELWNKKIINPTRPVIAIIDTGVDLTHPDLVDNLWTNQAEAEGEADYDNDGNGFKGDVHGWDFINNTGNIRDNNMHGTHVAGIAAASNNNIGIVGANPQALIMAVSVMQSDGTGDVATIIKGINYAVNNGATVLNLSLGFYANSKALRQALANAYGYAVIVAAAGNDGIPIDPECDIMTDQMFPAAYSFVLGVQATDESGTMAAFSNIDCNGPIYSSMSTLQDPDGFNYELKAPGANILSTIPGGKYKVLYGTSMAAPLVSGAISALTMVKDYSKDEGIHQEILWGDLTHTDNIAQAYALDNRPAELDLIRLQFQNRKELVDETEADYSGDHEIDAGETVSIYPVIRTTFGSASNIKMHLEMGDEFEDPTTVEIYSDADHKVDFGMRLDAYGRGVSLNPLEFKVANSVADNRHIKMKLVVTCDESNMTYEMLFTIIVTNMVKISGILSEDLTLSADHLYFINNNFVLDKNVTLTIEPGTRLEFANNTYLSAKKGKIVANGTPEKPIVFSSHDGSLWGPIYSHSSEGIISRFTNVYTNDSKTLFTLKQTDITPVQLDVRKDFYCRPSETIRNFRLEDYMPVTYYDLTNHQELLTDPNFLTPAILWMLQEWEDYCDQFPTSPTELETNHVILDFYPNIEWRIYDNPEEIISYCRFEYYQTNRDQPVMNDCVLTNGSHTVSGYGERNNIVNCIGHVDKINMRYSNFINNEWTKGNTWIPQYFNAKTNNYFNSFFIYQNKKYTLGGSVTTDTESLVCKSNFPPYLGSNNENNIRPYLYEILNSPSAYWIDLSNKPDHPYAEAHGIVWKVLVNGKDAQDEYEDLAPLGVGKHKFEVYFNRPMNKAVAPNISFGVRDPYTQNGVNEDGEGSGWNEEGTIYTAYKTITGKTKSDGVNRIYVYGAEDNEFFEIPYEKSRFNIQIQAAGSMATGFMAEPGLGRVNLTWNNDNNNFEDAMGFNVYRYQLDADGNEVNSTRLNTDIVDIEATEYTDYNVTPGETYHYYYKVLSTDLQEYDVSNVVAATPLTSELGDANGDTFVDVSDVITTVNYAAGMEPKPFIFEAADMNTDQLIDILDVVGIIQKILHPTAAPAMTMNEATAVYTIEDGVLYVESPVALAGVQAQINLDGRCKKDDVRVAADLDGFEHTSAWLSDNDYLFLAYNLNGKTLAAGKHALLYIGDADVSTLRLSDVQGHSVNVVAGEGTTNIDAMGSKVMRQEGIYDLQGRKVTTLKKGVYIVNGEKVVK